MINLVQTMGVYCAGRAHEEDGLRAGDADVVRLVDSVECIIRMKDGAQDFDNARGRLVSVAFAAVLGLGGEAEGHSSACGDSSWSRSHRFSQVIESAGM